MKNTVKVFNNIKDYKKYLKSLQVLPNDINRIISADNCNKLKISILTNGLQRELNVVVSSVFTGIDTPYIADGQHLKDVILSIDDKKIEGTPSVRINYSEDKDEIIKLISSLNSTGTKWTLGDFGKSWAANGKKDYKLVLDTAKELNIRLNPVIELYNLKGVVGTGNFKAGIFKADKNKGKEILKIYDKCLNAGLYKSSSTLSAIIRLYNKNQDMENVIKIIKMNKHLFNHSITRDRIIENIKSFNKLNNL